VSRKAEKLPLCYVPLASSDNVCNFTVEYRYDVAKSVNVWSADCIHPSLLATQKHDINESSRQVGIIFMRGQGAD